MTLDLILDGLSWLFLLSGSVFIVIGAIGIVRLPDVFARMHGAGMVDTLGTALLVLGLMIQAGWGIVALKLALIGVFLYFTSPTTSHALARAALNAGVKPFLGTNEAESQKEESEPSKT